VRSLHKPILYTANFFFESTFDFVSGNSINYACAVKNDTPIICNLQQSADGILERERGDEVINEKLRGTVMDIVI